MNNLKTDVKKKDTKRNVREYLRGILDNWERISDTGKFTIIRVDIYNY